MNSDQKRDSRVSAQGSEAKCLGDVVEVEFSTVGIPDQCKGFVVVEKGLMVVEVDEDNGG